MIGARDFFDFDDAVTAPMHGFASCYDYWTRSSSRRFLADIRIPTRVLNALNDPFVPPRALATPAEVSPRVELHYPEQGGHVGFHAAGSRGRSRWLADYLLDYSMPSMILLNSHATLASVPRCSAGCAWTGAATGC
jgi:hypothetical protein